MKTAKLTILCAVFAMATFNLFAAPGVFSGRILDSNSLPLPGANVVISDLSIGCTTDVHGFYRLPKVPEGKHDVKVTYIGFIPVEKEVTIASSTNNVLDIELKEGVEMSELQVVGSISDQAKALNQQRASVNITNVISSDQVESFPDENIGDALKRVPGINVQYDQGEARFGNIRGLAPQMNSVTINGERIPSAEGETRSIQLDLVPSDMVQSIEVSKVITPDMDGDAIGGSVNLVTRSNPSKRRITAELGSGYNQISEKPMVKAYFLYADRAANDKLGYTFSGSYLDHSLGSDNKEMEWDKLDDGTVYASDFQLRQYFLQRIRASVSANFDYAFNQNHKIALKSIYNRRFDWENRYRLRYKDIEYDEANGQWYAEARRQTKGGANDDKYARLEDQTMMTFSLNGEHLLGDTKLDWAAAYSKASEERPQERYISYNNKLEDATNYIVPDFSDTRNVTIMPSALSAQNLSSAWGLKELTEENQYTEESDKNFRINYEMPLFDGQSALKVGARYRGKEKERDNDFYEYEPLSGNEDAFDTHALSNLKNWTRNNFLAGDYSLGKFVDKAYLGELDLTKLSSGDGLVLEELAGNYEATEDIYAGYVMWTQTVGDLKAVVGARLEQTNVTYSGFIYDEDAAKPLVSTGESTDDYVNVLPNINLRYKFSERTNLKLAWTNALARPDYYKLVPFQVINTEDQEMEIGNPNLEAMESMNFDVLGEHYFHSIGLVSAGIYYKDIKNVIVDEVRDNNYRGEIYELTQSVNGGDGYLLGAEVAFQRQLDFLPGVLRQMSFYANYTYNSSEFELNLDDREGEKIEMPGSPENQLNLSLGYDNDKLTTRLSFNYADAFIDEFGGSSFEDSYYDKVTYLDYNVSYQFNKTYQCYAKVNNILNQPLRYYQGSEDLTMQEEYYNTTFKVGVRMKF